VLVLAGIGGARVFLALLSLGALIALGVAVTALVKGNLPALHLTKRRHAVGLLVAALVLMSLVGSLMPKSPEQTPTPPLASQAETTTRTLPSGTLANPAHEKLIALSEVGRNAALGYVVEDENCRVTRSFFQGVDNAGDAFWSVACANGKAFQIVIENNSRASTRVLECEVLKAVGGTECFKKFRD